MSPCAFIHHPSASLVLGRIEVLGDQLVVVVAAHAAGLALWSLEAPPGTAVVFGAVAFEVALGCRRFLLEQSRRKECLTLIAAGREDLPLAQDQPPAWGAAPIGVRLSWPQSSG